MKKFQGNKIYKAYNEITRKMEIVTSESEVGTTQAVIPYFWENTYKMYVTIPGTEVYGYVPEV